MPPRPRKGVAKPVKKSKRVKYRYLDSDGNSVSSSSSTGQDEGAAASPSRTAGEPQQSRSAARAPSPTRKLSTASLPPSEPDPRFRQASTDDATKGQSRQGHPLEHTLFPELLTQEPAKDTAPDRPGSPSPEQRESPFVQSALTASTQPGNPPQKGKKREKQRKKQKKQTQEKEQLPAAVPLAPLLPLPPQTPPFEPESHIEDENENEHTTMSGGAYIPPSQHRHMRACMVCSIVRTEQQFKQNGCPNCESFLELANNSDAIQECTSQVFDGLIAVSDTSKSWVARSQRLEGYVPGTYAVQVEGVLPDEAIAAAENAGVHYVPRDGSVNEALPTDA